MGFLLPGDVRLEDFSVGFPQDWGDRSIQVASIEGKEAAMRMSRELVQGLYLSVVLVGACVVILYLIALGTPSLLGR